MISIKFLHIIILGLLTTQRNNVVRRYQNYQFTLAGAHRGGSNGRKLIEKEKQRRDGKRKPLIINFLSILRQ